MIPLLGGFRVGRWLGFEIRIDWSWFLIFFLVVWTFSAHIFPAQLEDYSVVAYYTMGTVGALLLFLSVLFHELGHSVVARRRGIEVESITLFIFGGVAQTKMEAQEAIDEFLLTAAGPLTSVALGGLFWAVAQGSGGLGLDPAFETVASYLAFINLLLAAFNMIPGFPLDGGRILRSVIWHFTDNLEKATRWAVGGGRVFGLLLVALGVLSLLQGFFVNGLWAAFLGWFLASAADGTWRQFKARQILSGVRVEEVMTREPMAVRDDAPARALVDDFFLRRPYSAYPVVRGGRLVGLVTLEDVAGIPPDQRGYTPVARVMTSVEDVPTVEPDETLDEVLTHLAGGEHTRVLVVEGNELVGILTMNEIGGWLDRARKLGVEDPAARSGAPAGVGRGRPASGYGSEPEPFGKEPGDRRGGFGGRRP